MIVIYSCHHFLKLNQTFILMGGCEGLSVLLLVSVCIWQLFSQMKQSKACEVTLRAALEMKYMCSCSHILRAVLVYRTHAERCVCFSLCIRWNSTIHSHREMQNMSSVGGDSNPVQLRWYPVSSTSTVHNPNGSSTSSSRASGLNMTRIRRTSELHRTVHVTYHDHLKKTAAKISSRNNLLSKLASKFNWGVRVQTLKTTAHALCYSTAEYCAPVWSRSSHTRTCERSGALEEWGV